jgi:hypothetical protein
MKDVGLNRRRDNKKRASNKHQVVCQDLSTRSHVTDLSSSPSIYSTSTSTPSTEPTEFDDIEATIQNQSLVPIEGYTILYPNLSLAAGDYLYLRSKSDVDLSSLTILTDFNISRSTISSLASSPFRLPTILNHRQWSYLDHIPQRYPHSPCLAAATDCILAKAGNFLSPRPGGETSVLRLYAKALRLVQDAVASSSYGNPGVLCAVQLLSLHELFDSSGSRAWASHIEGSAKLIRHQSPSRFEADFEKALFAANVGPYVSECLYNGVYCGCRSRCLGGMVRSADCV